MVKQLYTLALTLLLGATGASAQVDNSLQFCDKDGKIIPDGSIVYVREAEDNGFGEIQLKTGLYVINTTTTDQGGMMVEDISAKPNGGFQTCAFGNCITAKDDTKLLNSNKGTLKAGEIHNIETEWLPKSYANQWTATLQLKVLEISKNKMGITTYKEKANGPKVNVVFVYADPQAIETISATDANATSAVRYTLGGRKVPTPVKGVNVVKLANGKTFKQMVR